MFTKLTVETISHFMQIKSLRCTLYTYTMLYVNCISIKLNKKIPKGKVLVKDFINYTVIYYFYNQRNNRRTFLWCEGRREPSELRGKIKIKGPMHPYSFIKAQVPRIKELHFQYIGRVETQRQKTHWLVPDVTYVYVTLNSRREQKKQFL